MLSEEVRSTVSAMKASDNDYSSLVKLVLSDFTLTQRVIRLANSAMYISFGGNITTVTRALMVLGTGAVGHLALGLKLVDHFQKSHSELHRLEVKLELNRALLAGSVARRLCEVRGAFIGEEAVVCSLMHQLGRLLCIFYLESEWKKIRELAETRQCSEDLVCHEVLGLGFDELGQEVAKHWGLPASISEGMKPFVPESGELVQSSVDWLRVIASMSANMAHCMTYPEITPEERDRAISKVAKRFSSSAGMPESLIDNTVKAFTKEPTSQHFIQQIEGLRVEAASLVVQDPVSMIENGIKDLQSLESGQPLGPMLSMVLETMSGGMKFSRAVIFLRDQANGCYRATLGFGLHIDERLPQLQFQETFSVDVFHLAITNSVGIFIENARDPRFMIHLPAWFREAMPEARSLVLLPVRVEGRAEALIYGDWTDPALVRKIKADEMRALNELAAELSRFFAAPIHNPIQMTSVKSESAPTSPENRIPSAPGKPLKL